MSKDQITINLDTEILQAIQQDIRNIKESHDNEIKALKQEIESLKRRISILNKPNTVIKAEW